MEEEIPLLPVAGFEITQVPAFGALFIGFDYLGHLTQEKAQAKRSPNYLIHIDQARELAQKILAGCDRLESGPPPTGVGPRH